VTSVGLSLFNCKWFGFFR